MQAQLTGDGLLYLLPPVLTGALLVTVHTRTSTRSRRSLVSVACWLGMRGMSDLPDGSPSSPSLPAPGRASPGHSPDDEEGMSQRYSARRHSRVSSANTVMEGAGCAE
ncbi:hypothetical protein GCM10009603_46630 [Nocardiopsis exhalans]